MSLRRRPLHTCGASALAIANSSCTIARNFNGPLGIVGNIARVALIASLVIRALQFILLPILSFIDNRIILSVENRIETLYPPTTYFFDKIDELVKMTETLPGKFDNAVSKIPTSVHQVPFLDWGLVNAISWISVMISFLTHWRLRKSKEKEIRIDTNCENESTGSNDHSPAVKSPVESPIGISNKGKFPPISKKNPEIKLASAGSYKLALKKGKKDLKEALEKARKEENKEDEFIESSAKARNDPILDLFESGWLKSSTQKQDEVTEENIQHRSVLNGTDQN